MCVCVAYTQMILHTHTHVSCRRRRRRRTYIHRCYLPLMIGYACLVVAYSHNRTTTTTTFVTHIMHMKTQIKSEVLSAAFAQHTRRGGGANILGVSKDAAANKVWLVALRASDANQCLFCLCLMRGCVFLLIYGIM